MGRAITRPLAVFPVFRYNGAAEDGRSTPDCSDAEKGGTGQWSPLVGSTSALAPKEKEENTMLYLLDFQVDYPAGMAQGELFATWAREADVILDAKKTGMVLDLWKCVGKRRVIAVVDVDDHDVLDRILIDLPIMKELGKHAQVEVTPLRRYEDFVADIKKRLE
jgi:muconolactone delta-isomerase